MAWRSDYYRMVDKEATQAKQSLEAKQGEVAAAITKLNSLGEGIRVQEQKARSLGATVKGQEVIIKRQSQEHASLTAAVKEALEKQKAARMALTFTQDELRFTAKNLLLGLMAVRDDSLTSGHLYQLIYLVRSADKIGGLVKEDVLRMVKAVAFHPLRDDSVLPLVTAAALCKSSARQEARKYLLARFTDEPTPLPADVWRHPLIQQVFQMAEFDDTERRAIQQVRTNRGLSDK